MATNEEKFTPYAWEELKERWERDEITVEQLGGQLLIWSAQLHRMLVLCQRAQESMAHELELCQHEQEGLGHAMADLEARLQDLADQVRAWAKPRPEGAASSQKTPPPGRSSSKIA